LPWLLDVSDLLTGTRVRWRSADSLVLGLSILALVAQGSVFLVWPSLSDSMEVQLLAIPLLLISFRWWENFANTHEAIGMCLTMTISRQYVHMYIYTYIYNSKAHSKLSLNDS